MPEIVLEQWLKWGIAVYTALPLSTELVFSDPSQNGFPDVVADGLLTDRTKRWIPDSAAGSIVRYGGVTFPITGNTRQELMLIGDPSQVSDVDSLGYQIIPAAAAKLAAVLASKTLNVHMAYPQLPTQYPSLMITLAHDIQDTAYWGSGAMNHVIQATGAEYTYYRTHIQGRYYLSILSTNRLECSWLYAWLLNWYVQSRDEFGSWGFSDIGMEGTDVAPIDALLPAHVSAKHFLLQATRTERALRIINLDEITGWDVTVLADYARLVATLKLP